jgi:hypothetical protein
MNLYGYLFDSAGYRFMAIFSIRQVKSRRIPDIRYILHETDSYNRHHFENTSDPVSDLMKLYLKFFMFFIN